MVSPFIDAAASLFSPDQQAPSTMEKPPRSPVPDPTDKEHAESDQSPGKKAKSSQDQIDSTMADAINPASPALVVSAPRSPAASPDSQLPSTARVTVEIRSTTKPLDHEATINALVAASTTAREKVCEAILADRIAFSNNGHTATVHLRQGSPLSVQIYQKLRAQTKKFPQFTFAASVIDTASNQDTTLFITFGYNFAPETVAQAVAQALGCELPFVQVRRGETPSSRVCKMFYIVRVPPHAYDKACGAIIQISKLGNHMAMLAPAVRVQYERGLRRFRFTFARDLIMDCPDFIKALQNVSGQSIKFWDCGRQLSGLPTNTITVAIEPETHMANFMDELVERTGVSEGEIDGFFATFKLTEVTKEEYDAREADRRGGQKKNNS